MDNIPDTIIYCQICRHPTAVPPAQARRRYCDACRPLALSLAGKRGGRKPEPVAAPQ